MDIVMVAISLEVEVLLGKEEGVRGVCVALGRVGWEGDNGSFEFRSRFASRRRSSSLLPAEEQKAM